MAKGPDLFDLPSIDPSKRASSELQNALGREGVSSDDIVILDEKLKERQMAPDQVEKTDEAVTEIPPVLRVDASLARTGERILSHEVGRNGVRLLILSRDETILDLGSMAQRRMVSLAHVFAEIHVVILALHGREGTGTVRIADNLWAYHTQSTQWWRTGFDAFRIANEQLTFAGGFRADVVLAEDPFESGLAGYYLAKKHGRSFQLHVLDDLYDPTFKDEDEFNGIRLFCANFVLKRAQCISTRSAFLHEALVEEHPELSSVTETLPVYHDLSVWRDSPPSFSLRDRYPQFKFIMLHVSSMRTSSHSSEVLAGAARILRLYPTVGLIVVGNGPLRGALEKQAIALGVGAQVEFEPMPKELISHMKTANILIHLSESSEEEEVPLMAATVRLPMILGATGIVRELFIDGESALMCPGLDAVNVSERINQYLNGNEARARFALSAQETVFERVEQDYGAYLDAYRMRIERCMAGTSSVD